MARTALVTGGNRGIGLAIAKGLVSRGHDVVIGARDRAAGEAAANDIGARSVELDVSDRAAIDRVGEQLGGDIDILINNAGVLFKGSMLDHLDDVDTSMSVMVDGPFRLIRTFAPGMEAKGWGRIVNVSSGWGSFAEGLGGPNAYGVAKAALNALSHALVRDLPSTTKINAMCPGWVHTRMGGANAPRTPEQGADTAIWLATLTDDGPTGGFFRDRQSIDW